MLEAALVYSFKKHGQTFSLFVDSVKKKSEYWLEIQRSNGDVEVSEKVYSWDAAVHLLEEQQWTDYPNDKIELSFADWILKAKERTPGKGKVKKYNAQQRLLEILRRLEQNETIYMENAKREFAVKNAQIQRDIAALREFYQYSNKMIDYIRTEKGYQLTERGDYFTIDDALIVLLFLYGSRALNEKELKDFSNKIIALFSQIEQIKLREFFQSYLYTYKPVQEHSLFDLFYQCFQAISRKQILLFTYTNNAGVTKEREVLPNTISYHDGKFYLLARLKGREDAGPRFWQMDRINHCRISPHRFSKLPDDLKAGEYIQKAVNMYGGDPIKVRLRVAPSNVPFLKRKFPEVLVAISENQWYEAKLEVLGLNGIQLWILQQGPCVEVLEPLELRENIKTLIIQMHQMYFAQVKGRE